MVAAYGREASLLQIRHKSNSSSGLPVTGACRERDSGKVDRNKRETSAERRAKIAEWNKGKKEVPA
jgi:hypothetical protein